MSQQSNATAGKAFIATRTVDIKVQSLPHYLRKRSPGWAKQIVSGITLISLSLSLLASGKAEAISITFEKIVDTNTPIPGGTGNFDYFDNDRPPSLDNGNVAFLGSGDFVPDFGFSQSGIYTNANGVLDIVADRNTPIPDGIGNFEAFGSPSLDEENVAFTGSNSSSYDQKVGIYINVDGVLKVVADTNTSIPEGKDNFIGFSSPSLDNGSVAFAGYDPVNSVKFSTGIYIINADGVLKVVANTNTMVPGNTKNFTNFSTPSLDNGKVAFEGFGEDPFRDSSIYTGIDGVLDVIADFNTPIPGGTEAFIDFNDLSLDNGNVAFESGGIYTSIDGVLNVIADRNTPIPNETGTFTEFVSPAFDSGNVAFLGLDSSSNKGIYTDIGGTLAGVITGGDLLDGKRVGSVNFGSEGLSNNQIAFTAYFDDGSQGIYIATVPEPTSALGTLAFGAFGTGWMLKRRQSKQKLTSRTKRIDFKA